MPSQRGWMVLFAVFVVALWVTQAVASYDQQVQVVGTQRASCLRGARHTVDTLNFDYIVFTADERAPERYRHAEASGILAVASDVATDLDEGVLTGSPRLRWPEIRAVVAASPFRCRRAYPAAAFSLL